MNTSVIAQALERAGVKVPPVSERVWRWLKDHPDSTADTISSTLKIHRDHVYSALYKLRRCGLAENKAKAEFSPKYGRNVNVARWHVVGDTYDPQAAPARPTKPAKHKVKVTADVAPTPPVAAPSSTVEAPSITAIMHQIEQMRFVDVMRLRELLNQRFSR